MPHSDAEATITRLLTSTEIERRLSFGAKAQRRALYERETIRAVAQFLGALDGDPTLLELIQRRSAVARVAIGRMKGAMASMG